MKLEKRSEGGPVEPAEEETPKGKKPVVVYIMILFIAAFLLMAWSFASHQRSNTEALGRLQSSVGAMREVQDLQDQVIALQKELAEAKEQLEQEQENAAAQAQQAAEAQASADLLRRNCDALYYLYALQQQYLLQDFDGCRETIQTMESLHLAELLSDGGGAVDVTSTYERYLQLKEAVEAREGQAEP